MALSFKARRRDRKRKVAQAASTDFWSPRQAGRSIFANLADLEREIGFGVPGQAAKKSRRFWQPKLPG